MQQSLRGEQGRRGQTAETCDLESGGRGGGAAGHGARGTVNNEGKESTEDGARGHGTNRNLTAHDLVAHHYYCVDLSPSFAAPGFYILGLTAGLVISAGRL